MDGTSSAHTFLADTYGLVKSHKLTGRILKRIKYDFVDTQHAHTALAHYYHRDRDGANWPQISKIRADTLLAHVAMLASELSAWLAEGNSNL